MGILLFGKPVWTLVGLLMLLCFSFASSYWQEAQVKQAEIVESRVDSSITPKYDRLDEVKQECRSVISSASKMKSDDNRVYRIRSELTFLNGDWEQEADKAPLVPFDDRDMSKEESDMLPPSKLVSFWVTDVDEKHRSEKTYNVNGMLYLGITRNGSFAFKPYDGAPHFQMWPGNSQLMISFQGVYVESKKNGGERVFCLLGDTMLPSRNPDMPDPWEWMKASNYYQPPLLQDDRILLVLRYPKTLTLTSRAVLGDLKSLNEESSLKYFDKVHISSQLGAYVNYEFGSEQLVSKACNPYPFKDGLLDGGVDIYKGSSFCEILERFTSGEGLNVVPNWKCSGTDEYCRKLGPFTSGRVINATDGGFNNVRIVMQDVRCEPITGERNSSSARVSAVFRAVPPFENRYTSVDRSGITNLTLPSEGIWNSSSGQLCMIGCLGIVGTDLERCSSRVCLYIPTSFSIKQRSIVLGSISSINNKTGSFFPLSFEKVAQPSALWDRFSSYHLSYKYSKIDAAGAFLDRSESFDFRAVIRKSFLSYPAVEDGPAYLVSLSLLSEDLTLHVSAIPDPLPQTSAPRTSVELEILSLGPLFGRYWSQNISLEVGAPFHVKEKSTERELLLNVSSQLTLTGKPYSNFSMLFLEGLYDSRVGKMYLIGCRDVRASWKILAESMDLEGGLDCLIEVKVEYPPTTARWLINPTAMISISSRRTEDDPLYFKPVSLQTLPILYRKQREDILSRKGIEGLLRVLTLTLAITCILSQLLYIRDKVDDVPYMSLVMLGVQALGYSIPLITGAEALFKKMSSDESGYETPSYDLKKSQWFNAIDYAVKLLILVAFLLTLRLCQKVWKSRIRLLTRTPLEPGRVPSDRRVLLVSLAIHTVGFVIVLIVHMVNASQRPLRQQKFVDSRGNSYTMREWEIELQEYVGLIQDFFLLPQIIGNILWQINGKPFRKVYYFGITVVRLLPHVYDYVRAPVFNPYFSEEYEFVNPTLDFYSRFGDVAIPLTAVVLAILVYIQQRWSYQKISQTIGQCKLLPLGSKVYERLPSVSFEAELASGVNGTVADERKQETEE